MIPTLMLEDIMLLIITLTVKAHLSKSFKPLSNDVIAETKFNINITLPRFVFVPDKPGYNNNNNNYCQNG